MALCAAAVLSAVIASASVPAAVPDPCAGRKSGKAAPIQWVKIPGGTFMMGEGIQKHQVKVPPFRLAKTAVTFGQYCRCVAAGVCTPPEDQGARFNGDDQPVGGVDWEQARVFSKWAGGRLPSEAEWEYAAKSAGKDWRYPWGDEEATCARAVMNDEAAQGPGCGKNATWPVCSKPDGHTLQGLCDMTGNISNWVQDWYHDSYEGAPADGRAWESPATKVRVMRGGSWSDSAPVARAARRHRGVPGFKGSGFGFRPAR